MHHWFTSLALMSWGHSPPSWASWFFNLVMSEDYHLLKPELRLDYELVAPMDNWIWLVRFAAVSRIMYPRTIQSFRIVLPVRPERPGLLGHY